MTIKEIAQLAGVSSAAVSRYLNGGYVSEGKKEQIRKVIEETGYQPSAQARMLRTKKASLVGVVVRRSIPNPSAGSLPELKVFSPKEAIRCFLPEPTTPLQRK